MNTQPQQTEAAQAQPLQRTPPRTYVNSSTTGNYTAPRWNVRAGADQHQQYQRRGF